MSLFRKQFYFHVSSPVKECSIKTWLTPFRAYSTQGMLVSDPRLPNYRVPLPHLTSVHVGHYKSGWPLIYLRSSLFAFFLWYWWSTRLALESRIIWVSFSHLQSCVSSSKCPFLVLISVWNNIPPEAVNIESPVCTLSRSRTIPFVHHPLPP